jgi:mRNA interferase RelE/StbE
MPEPYKSAIVTAIERLKTEPPQGNIRPLTGQKGKWRLKVGNYRILYQIQKKYVYITHIEPRGQAYTKKTKEEK